MDILYLWPSQALVRSITFKQNIGDFSNDLETTVFQTRLQFDLYYDLYLRTGCRYQKNSNAVFHRW